MTDQNENWWGIVLTFSEFVANGIECEDLEDEGVIEALSEMGYSSEDVDKAFEWVERASIQGNLTEILAMFQPVPEHRVASQMERLFVPDRVLQKIENLRMKGIVSSDAMERIMMSLRSMDTRDWDDIEMRAFLKEIITDALPSFSDQKIDHVLAAPEFGKDFYC